MPRRPGVWVHGRDQVFKTTIDGEQVSLGVPGPDTPAARALAEAALARLIDERIRAAALPAAPPPPGGPPVAEAVRAYLAGREGRLHPRALAYYRSALAALVAAFGPRPVGSLAGPELERWAARDGWAPSTRHLYLGVVLGLLRAHGHAPRVERPGVDSRGAEVALTDEQHAAVLAEVRRSPRCGDLPALLQALRATGARPQELAPRTAAEVDWANRCVRLARHKTRRRTGRPKVIRLNADAMAVLGAQRDKYGGAGLLFRNAAGRAYANYLISDWLVRAGRRLGFRVICYGLGRHSFATRALAAGLSDAVVAGLLGHTSTAMVHAHYSHIAEDARLMQDAAEKVSRGRAAG